ncbi:MAG TPA: heavy metal-associated domain-containing protein [Polyangiaceae bacterium]|jgi:copper chaperone CopZ|nr:heavy metal-associated domain-containing protein [Polyangiaceae bacterium]
MQTVSVKYEVKGMTCAGCQRSVAAALGRAGIKVTPDDVSVSEGTVRVNADAPDATVRRAIEDAGYDVGARLA